MTGIDKKKLALGAVLMVSFLAVLGVIFMPLFDGGNALNYLDNLYNSISKASANYFDKARAEVGKLGGGTVAVTVNLGKPELASQGATLLAAAGAKAEVTGASLRIEGDLQRILASCLADAESAYHNRGEEIADRYQLDAKTALHAWWKTLAGMEKAFTQGKQFALVRALHSVRTKALECAYNYYGIRAQPISQRWGIVVFSLVFYVLYTVWYGYAVLYLFEGLGLKMGH
jgi:hypothetical protein